MPVAVVGLGASGKLLTQILLHKRGQWTVTNIETGGLRARYYKQEKGRPVLVAARNPDPVREMEQKYGAIPHDFHDMSYLSLAHGILLALSNNDSTRNYVARMADWLSCHGHRVGVVVDMATPPLVTKGMFDVSRIRVVDSLSAPAEIARAQRLMAPLSEFEQCTLSIPHFDMSDLSRAAEEVMATRREGAEHARRLLTTHFPGYVAKFPGGVC